MSEQEDKSAKTEDPTAKRLEDARKKGDLVKSQDVSVWFIILGLTSLTAIFKPISHWLGTPLYAFIEHPHQFILDDSQMAMALLPIIGQRIALPLSVMFGVLTLAALLGHLVQHRPVWTFEKLKPKLDKISPIKGFSRLFGAQGWMNLFKAILKLCAVSAALFVVLWPERSLVQNIGLMPFEAIIAKLISLSTRLCAAALLAIGVVAIIDYVWQRHSFAQKMKMSRRDIKDETKQAEGDPQIRARLRAIRQQKARQRMMAAVPDATVVIANPTHYSVALKYDPDQSVAPVCVALGLDTLALRIRQVAEESGVPVIVNPPLARSLHAGSELDEPIRVENYEAVAKIISFVMQQKARNQGYR